MNNIRKLYLDHPGVSATLSVIIMLGLLHFLRMIPLPYEISYVFSEIVVAVITIIVVYLINGGGEIFYSTKGFGYGFKLAWWPLLLAIVEASLMLAENIYSHRPLLGNPFLSVLGAIVLAIMVGYFEEGLFRGIVLNAFLTKMGGSFKGVLQACIYSSIIFGFVHVYSQFFELFINPSTFSMLALYQMIGKTLSVAIFGFILAVIFLRTRNLFVVAVIHAINDLGPFIPTFLYTHSQFTNYVQTNPIVGIAASIEYVVQFVLLLPAAYYAYKQLKKISIPQWGMFEQTFVPVSVTTKSE